MSIPETREVLSPTGNRLIMDSEEANKKTIFSKKPQINNKTEAMPVTLPRRVSSTESSISSDSSLSSSCSSVITSGSKKRVAKRNSGVKSGKVTTNRVVEIAAKVVGPVKKCDWITPNSDPVYISFHDEEWGVPIHDDKKLFELLVFSQALAELSWPAILNKRDIFRKFFENFDPLSVSQFTEKKLCSLKVEGSLILSEPKLRAIVDNAKLILKIQQEFGSFRNYTWRFVNHKPIQNGFRYSRHIPIKSPKAEFISKDMIGRGFRCVGPTVVYSFMQVTGIVNDHLVACFRHQQCRNAAIDDKCLKQKTDNEEPDGLKKKSTS